MSNGSDIKPTDLRGILKYVPRFQGQTFVIALDGIIVAEERGHNKSSSPASSRAVTASGAPAASIGRIRSGSCPAMTPNAKPIRS